MDQLYWFMSRAYSDLRSEGRRWTEEEDAQLRSLVELKGRRWKEIERDMARTDCKVGAYSCILLTRSGSLE